MKIEKQNKKYIITNWSYNVRWNKNDAIFYHDLLAKLLYLIFNLQPHKMYSKMIPLYNNDEVGNYVCGWCGQNFHRNASVKRTHYC